MIQELYVGGELIEIENLDFEAVFKIANLYDISKREDKVSKTITIKGTPANEKIFNNLFSLNRVSIPNTGSTIGTAFQINSPSEVYYFEDGNLIFKGNIRVTKGYEVDGVNYYDCLLLGDVIDFYKKLGDKYLEDLSFTASTHSYILDNINSSWTSTGFDYLYPFIDYGENSSLNAADVNKIDYRNFRPAIYVTSYLDKIFNQAVLSGYTYEIKGNTDFIADFNSLIVPSDEDYFRQTNNGSHLFTLTKTGTTSRTTNDGSATTFLGTYVSYFKLLIPFETKVDTSSIVEMKSFNSKNNIVYEWKKDVLSNIGITVTISITNKDNNPAFNTYLRLVERPQPTGTTESNSFSNWQVVSTKTVGTVAVNSTLTDTVTLTVPEKEYTEGKQFAVMVYLEGGVGVQFTSTDFGYSITTGTLKTPSVPTTKATYRVKYGDNVAPKPVSGVKQSEFIKSLITMFNLYVYPSSENSKHIIFEPYDNFYSFTQPEYLASTALDWSNKVVSDSLEVYPFEEYAKVYPFSYKDDYDYYNEDRYKKRYGLTYGNYTSTNSAGTGEEKKIEVIFSPTPVVEYNDTQRMHPNIFKYDTKRSPFKSNIRILYYNGLKTCASYNIGIMTDNGNGTFTYSSLPVDPTFTNYPLVHHIKFEDGLTNYTYKSDLNFGEAKEYFFGVTSAISTVPNTFKRFYYNQIVSYANPDSKVVECDILLNASDISNLDFKVPIFLDTRKGSGYFKVISITYGDSKTPSSVKLQQIMN